MASKAVDQRWASLALFCLDAGMLTDEMPVDKALTLVQKAFQDWLSAQLSDLKCLDRFDMFVASDISEVDDFQAVNDEFVVVCSPDTPEREFFIGERISFLEEMVPGLGQTVLAAVQFASARTFPLWTPDSIMDEAANFYWSGATTMDEWLEEMEINYGTEGDGWSREDYLSPGQFCEGFPYPWIVAPSEALDVPTLEGLARGHADGKVRKVAQLAAEIQAMRKRWQQNEPCPALPDCSEEDAYVVYRSATLRWSKEDLIPRVVDDYIQYCNENADGFTDSYSIGVMPMTMEGFLQWKSDMEGGIGLYKLLDSLVALIGEPYLEEEENNAQS
jgi:PRTRC genetic system protein F